MNGMGFMNAAETTELVGKFGAADSVVAFEMGTDGVATSIPGLGQESISNELDGLDSVDRSKYDVLDM